MTDPTEQHRQALNETGFWGRRAAGCVLLAESSGRFLLPKRAPGTLQAGTWGTWGGAVDDDETPEDTVRRELSEEAGYQGQATLYRLYTFSHQSGFTYHNFLAVIDKEFTPVINWETEVTDWFKFGHWPEPLHFGFQAVLDDAKSHATILARL